MADVRLGIKGDASGAKQALDSVGDSTRKLADETGKAAVKWQVYAEAAKKALEAVVELAKESVTAALEQEKADRQLKLVAGELTDAFKAQAEQLQRTLGVSDDMVQGMQTMALRFGAMPSQVDETVRAVLDFAAATGSDASSAMDSLMRGVESGSGSIKSMGIHFESTGSKSKDLELAVAALNQKFGGASATEADSLAGSARIVSAQFDELKESFGNLIIDFAKSTGVLVHLREAMDDIANASKWEEKQKKLADLNRNLTAAQEDLNTAMERYNELVGNQSSEDAVNAQAWILENEKKRVQAARDAIRAFTSGASDKLPDKPLIGDDKTKREAKSDSKEHEKAWADTMKFMMDGKEQIDANERSAKEAADAEKRRVKELMEDLKKKEKARADEEKDETKRLERLEQLADRRMEETRRALAEEERLFQQAGQNIGAALVNAFAAQLAKLGSGGEFDVAEFIASILPMIGAAVGSIIPGVGTAIGGGLGTLAGAGVSAINRSLKKKHDGGWIERYHAGGWPGLTSGEVPIIAQTGERVASRTEVARMGGPARFDAMLAGGGGGGGQVVINLSTPDVKSTQEWFEDRGGRALRNAVRSGRGDVSRLLGGYLR